MELVVPFTRPLAPVHSVSHFLHLSQQLFASGEVPFVQSASVGEVRNSAHSNPRVRRV